MKTVLKKRTVALFATCLFTLFACSSEDDEQSNSFSDDEEVQALCTGKENYLGIGYDVISSSYINRGDAKIAHPVLDQNKMCKAGIINTAAASEQDFKAFTGSSIKEFYQERNASINIDVAPVFFSGKFKTEFSNATNETSAEKIYYSRVRSYRYTQDDYIKSATAQNLSNYLTETFTNDLASGTAKEILDQYGTHVFIRYFKGGSLEANYTYTGSSLTSNNAVRLAVEASFSGISGGGSLGTSNTNVAEIEKSSFRYYTYGGKALGATSIQQLKSEYGDWTNSIESNSDICGIGNFDQSFIPIWELAKAAGETAKATELEDEFKERAKNQGIAFPGARNYKTDTKTDSISGTVTLSYPNSTIMEIEIYALGAGGGGQGGDRISDGCGFLWLDTCYDYGTGGAGGGGAVTYVKLGKLGLDKNESVSLGLTIGGGGSGGYYYDGSNDYSGENGAKGGDTKVTYKNATVATALGGSGGGGNNTLTTGGAGGSTSSLPTSNNYYIEGKSEPGKNGNAGDWKKDMESVGGNAAKITSGTLESFGGGNGAIRYEGGSSTRKSEAGGGGRGGYGTNDGTAGGKGLVTIVVKYYTEE